MANDPNVGVVDLVAKALGPLAKEMMLVGGCAVGLLMTDEARPPVRQTADVDLVTEVVSIADYYHTLQPRLRECGFSESPTADHMCRWTRDNLMLDVMTTTQVLGHSVNRWYEEAFKHSSLRKLPSGLEINLISAPLFIATKLDSFHDRGKGDYFHHDMEDVLNVVDGRTELHGEIQAVGGEAMAYIAEELDTLLAEEAFIDAVEWQFPEGRAAIVISRLRAIAGA